MSSFLDDSLFVRNNGGRLFAQLRASSGDETGDNKESTEHGNHDTSDDTEEQIVLFLHFAKLAGESFGACAFVSIVADAVVGAGGGAGFSDRSGDGQAGNTQITGFADALEGISSRNAVAFATRARIAGRSIRSDDPRRCVSQFAFSAFSDVARLTLTAVAILSTFDAVFWANS